MNWTTYQCDICKKESNSSGFIWNHFNETKVSFSETCDMLKLLKIKDCCKECFNKLFDELLTAGKNFLDSNIQREFN